jgi:hypothetical protein
MKIAAICGGLPGLEQYRRAARGRAPAAALINTSPRAVHALAALRLTLQTMSAQIVDEACITLPCSGQAARRKISSAA